MISRVKQLATARENISTIIGIDNNNNNNNYKCQIMNLLPSCNSLLWPLTMGVLFIFNSGTLTSIQYITTTVMMMMMMMSWLMVRIIIGEKSVYPLNGHFNRRSLVRPQEWTGEQTSFQQQFTYWFITASAFIFYFCISWLYYSI